MVDPRPVYVLFHIKGPASAVIHEQAKQGGYIYRESLVKDDFPSPDTTHPPIFAI